MSQRAWIELNAAGHNVTAHLASDARSIEDECRTVEPDLVICPFLKDRVGADVWRHYRRSSSAPARWATGGRRRSTGPLQGTSRRGVSLRCRPLTKWTPTHRNDSNLPDAVVTGGAASQGCLSNNGEVADLAIELITEVVAKAANLTFEPQPLDYRRTDLIGRCSLQRARPIEASLGRSRILRAIRAAGGSHGVRTVLAGRRVLVFDAHPLRRRWTAIALAPCSVCETVPSRWRRGTGRFGSAMLERAVRMWPLRRRSWRRRSSCQRRRHFGATCNMR